VGLVLSFGVPKRAVTVPEALIQMLEKVAEKTNRARIITKVLKSLEPVSCIGMISQNEVQRMKITMLNIN
jgi:hypothetical protein